MTIDLLPDDRRLLDDLIEQNEKDYRAYCEAYFDECVVLKAEIERLRALLSFDDWERVAVEKIKAEVIEECAQAVENLAAPGQWPAYPEAAAAVRARKDKHA